MAKKKKNRFTEPEIDNSTWAYFKEQKGAAVIAILYITGFIAMIGAPAIGHYLALTTGFIIGSVIVFIAVNAMAAVIRKSGGNECPGEADSTLLIVIEVLCLFFTAIIVFVNWACTYKGG